MMIENIKSDVKLWHDHAPGRLIRKKWDRILQKDPSVNPGLLTSCRIVGFPFCILSLWCEAQADFSHQDSGLRRCWLWGNPPFSKRGEAGEGKMKSAPEKKEIKKRAGISHGSVGEWSGLQLWAGTSTWGRGQIKREEEHFRVSVKVDGARINLLLGTFEVMN